MPRFWKWLIGLVFIAGLPALLGVDGCGGGGGLLSIDQPTEIQIGQQAAADMERQYGVVNDPVQLNRINRIGRSIAAVTTRPDLPWSFKILNMSDINAVSLPGGPVYVTRGLLALNIPDAELAGVLGHEIAHIQQRHAVKAIQQAMTYQLLSDLVLGHSSAAVQNAAGIAVQHALELPQSRQNEYEADSVGIRLAYNTGYPASGLVAFLQRLETISGPDRTPAFFQTHPSTPDRVARAQQIAAQVSTQPRPVPVSLTDKENRDIKNLPEDKAQVEAARP